MAFSKISVRYWGVVMDLTCAVDGLRLGLYYSPRNTITSALRDFQSVRF